jgi:hypothetical protein
MVAVLLVSGLILGVALVALGVAALLLVTPSDYGLLRSPSYQTLHSWLMSGAERSQK